MATRPTSRSHLRIDRRPERESDPRALIDPANRVRTKRVGLLALQGDFDLHRKAVVGLGHEAVEVRTVNELATVDCLIMPGGESSTMRKLMMKDGLWEAIQQFGQSKPIMGTCAGLILLGKQISDRPDEPTLGLLDVDTARNAYGRQLHSFRDTGTIELNGAPASFEMVFIRAPRITRVGEGVEIVGRYDDDITIVRQGKILGLTFHPELSGDARVHEHFLSTV